MYFWDMKRLLLLICFFAFPLALLFGQSVEVRNKKGRDLSIYKTFEIGGGDVITPKDQQIVDTDKLKSIVIEALVNELKNKGLQQVETGGDLIATFTVGSVERSSTNEIGPFGGTPATTAGVPQDRSTVEDIRAGNLTIDLRDKSKNLIWGVSGEGRSDLNDPLQLIDEVIEAGFKKFSLKPPKKKGKKR